MATSIKKITTNKKVVAQPKPQPQRRVGWYENSGDEFIELNEYIKYVNGVDIYYRDSTGRDLYIYFEECQLPYCCGVNELGALGIHNDFPQKQFNELMKAFCENRKGTTLIINTNGNSDSIVFETLLSKCPHFVAVKQFTNINSKNIITIWISNNE